MIAASPVKPWQILFVKLFLGGALLLGLGCLAAFEERRQTHLERLENDEIAIVAAQISAINDALHRIRADLYILSRQSELDDIAPGSPQLIALAREYAEFERAIGVYEDIRLIDADGTLLIDIDNDGGEVHFNTRAARGSEADLADLRALSGMNAGGLLMSRPFREATSPRPLIRFGIAVPGDAATPPKALLLSFRADVLLDRLAQLAARSPSTFILADRDGHWVSRPDAPYTWGFDRHDSADNPLIRAYPKALVEIAETEGGTVRAAGGVFVFRTAHPAIKGFWGIEPGAPPSPEVNEWKVISFISPAVIATIESGILEVLVPFALAALLSLGLASWLFAITWAERQHRHHYLMLRATTDPLTGALNRSAFDERLEAALRRYRDLGEGCALIFVDLDDFKAVNDIHGHDAGDACLRETVACLRAAIRDTDAVGRLGGDEFAAILSPCKSRSAAVAVAAKIGHKLDALPAPYPGAADPIRASIGIALCPEDGTSAEMLLRCADQAMYGAKRDRHDRRHAAPGPESDPSPS